MEALKAHFHSLCHKDMWPFTAEYPLMVGRKRNQQETALPSPALGGSLTPIDVLREASRACRGCEQSFATPAQGSAGQKSMSLPSLHSILQASALAVRGGQAARTKPAQLLLGCLLVSCYPFSSSFNYFPITGGFS